MRRPLISHWALLGKSAVLAGVLAVSGCAASCPSPTQEMPSPAVPTSISETFISPAGETKRPELPSNPPFIERFSRLERELTAAKERESRATERARVARLQEDQAREQLRDQTRQLRLLRSELEEARHGRDTAQEEVAELRRKLRALTSIERSIDQRRER